MNLAPKDQRIKSARKGGGVWGAGFARPPEATPTDQPADAARLLMTNQTPQPSRGTKTETNHTRAPVVRENRREFADSDGWSTGYVGFNLVSKL